VPAVSVSYYCFVRVAETFVAEKRLTYGTQSVALAKFSRSFPLDMHATSMWGAAITQAKGAAPPRQPNRNQFRDPGR